MEDNPNRENQNQASAVSKQTRKRSRFRLKNPFAPKKEPTFHIVSYSWNPEGKQVLRLFKMEYPSGPIPLAWPSVKDMKNVWTQTELTLPITLPKKLEHKLGLYSTFNEDQRTQTEEPNFTLCPRLLNFRSESTSSESSVVSVQSDRADCGSPVLSYSNRSKRNFDSLSNIILIPDEISPVHDVRPPRTCSSGRSSDPL